MIPKIAHRIWLDEPIPERWEVFWGRFGELHPGWELVTWNNSRDLYWMVNLDVFERQDNWAGKSDIARYEIVNRFGGVYLDTDVEPLKPFDDLLDGDPFVAWEDKRLLCPTVIGSEPFHPAVATLVAGLERYANQRRNRPPNQQTGPHYLTRMWRDRTDVRLLDPVTFYPVHWSERHRLGGSYPEESYAVHHWNQGWDPEAKARIDARQA